MRPIDLKWGLALGGVVIAAGLTLWFVFAQPRDTEVFEIPGQYSAATYMAKRIGRDIFDFDNAGNAAAAFMREAGINADERLRGWVVSRDGDRVLVSFLGAHEGSGAVLYEVAVRGTTVLKETYIAYGVPKPATEDQMALVTAVYTSREATIDRCAPSYNLVAMTDAKTGERVIYYLPAGYPADHAVVGGFVTVRVDAAGENVVGVTQSPAKCRTIPISEDLVGVGILYEEGETVTPFDVWASLAYSRPAHVKSKVNGLEWVVYGDQKIGLETLPAAEGK
ncbi:MAG: hypothetical protein AB7O49_08600 [Sphingomonadales bacterium]